MKFSALGLTALFLLAGCTSQTSPDDEPLGQPFDLEPYYPVVVAVIDTGVNPYHEHFQRASIPDHVLDRFVNTLDGEAPQRVSLAHRGDYEERVQKDEGFWTSAEKGRLYYFEGTNILGISFAGGSGVPVLDEAGHGTGTSGAVLDANPNAIVVMVQGTGNPDGEAWAAEQPWVDLLSESYGPIGSIPGSGRVFGLTTSQANKAAWDNGKLPVGAADNTPALSPNDETSGPPWVIGVGGDHPESYCREHISGNLPDFTADFTQKLPMAETIDEYRSMSGTSFSTPATAGTLSAIVQGVREAWGDTSSPDSGALVTGPDGNLTNIDVRNAVNQTAYYFDFQTCQGDGGGATPLPVNPAAPWLQMGWGHVGPEIVNATLEHLLGIKEAPAKPAGAVAFQESVHEYRKQLWAVLG